MEGHCIFIKEEPVWEAEPASDEGRLEVLPDIKSEPTASMGHGTEELGQSSYSAAINLAHKTTVKQEEPDDSTPGLSKFGFVDVNVDRALTTELICAPAIDPLQQPCLLATSLESGPDPRHIKQEPLDEVQLEPPEPQCRTTEVTCSSLMSDQGIVPTPSGSSHHSTASISGHHGGDAKTQHQVNGRSDEMTEHKCGQCEESFSDPRSLAKHTEVHSGEVDWTSHEDLKIYECDRCEATFSKECCLVTHIKLHSGGGNPHVCNVCKAEISKIFNETIHKSTNPSNKSYTCDICEERFSHNCYLKRHKMKHSGDKPYTCDMCGIQFSTNSSLIRHKRTHSGDKPYTCDICKAQFSANSNLIKHKRTHTGDKPYECDVCKARFSQNSNLNKHKRIHSGHKPYQCDICNARFIENNGLITHKRTHTGDKPYKCDVCEARFSQNSNMNEHKRIHLSNKPYECITCEKRFSQKSNLNKHKRKHFGDNP